VALLSQEGDYAEVSACHRRASFVSNSSVRLSGSLEGSGVYEPRPEQLIRLCRRIYQRSLTKAIGVIEAIDELLAEAPNEQDTTMLEQLRAEMTDYRRNYRRAR
jgi:hypothetical protein